MISIKSKREIELMKQAGEIVAKCHRHLKEIIKPGVTTLELDSIIEKMIVEHGAIPAFKGMYGFPFTICSSPNEQVVHGFANNKPLKNGDIISIDIGVKYKGYYGDSAWTYPVGNIDEEKQHLLLETEKALFAGLSVLREGIHLSDVSHAIEEHARKENLGIVKEMAGHGIGSELHEAPEILNYGTGNKGPILKAGMTLAIEPMLNAGTGKIKFHKDGWTTTTNDKKPSAHFEHTVVVTKEGYEILTTIQEDELNETRSH